MYERELEKCQKAFQAYGLPVPEVYVDTTESALSWHNDKGIHLGVGARILDLTRIRGAKLSILRELSEMFIEQFTPPTDFLELAGGTEPWLDAMVHVLNYVEMWDPPEGEERNRIKLVRRWFNELKGRLN